MQHRKRLERNAIRSCQEEVEDLYLGGSLMMTLKMSKKKRKLKLLLKPKISRKEKSRQRSKRPKKAKNLMARKKKSR